MQVLTAHWPLNQENTGNWQVVLLLPGGAGEKTPWARKLSNFALFVFWRLLRMCKIIHCWLNMNDVDTWRYPIMAPLLYPKEVHLLPCPSLTCVMLLFVDVSTMPQLYWTNSATRIYLMLLMIIAMAWYASLFPNSFLLSLPGLKMFIRLAKNKVALNTARSLGVIIAWIAETKLSQHCCTAWEEDENNSQT